jgi:hypothetical protein
VMCDIWETCPVNKSTSSIPPICIVPDQASPHVLLCHTVCLVSFILCWGSGLWAI